MKGNTMANEADDIVNEYKKLRSSGPLGDTEHKSIARRLWESIPGNSPEDKAKAEERRKAKEEYEAKRKSVGL